MPAHVVHHGGRGSAAVFQRRVAFHAADEVPRLFKAVPHGAAPPSCALHTYRNSGLPSLSKLANVSTDCYRGWDKK